MVTFVVQGHDVLDAHKLFHGALHHLALGLQGLQRGARSLQQRSASTGNLNPLLWTESVVVGDDYLCALEISQHIAGD